ncbi:class I SAM-dependent methyltransferase [Bryobacter aggregatus]|uniref:class I SAM-dependent methyltransferase n=1 Tax=Bryobacter aggregatus TaxID=360054 RepID=UPI00068B76A2|nr:class I SAM-dependent methyltransferase [Bryobacter aggregatus]
MTNLEGILENWRTERIPVTIANRTRRIYSLVAGVYPVSSYLFHAKAHRIALDFAAIKDGMNVLEVAVGSGEMFSRIAERNSKGLNVGVDISPEMAAMTMQRMRREHPKINCTIEASDARMMPFRDQSFDAVMCCYLLELLASNDIVRTLNEVKRVLKPGGTFTLIMIGQNREYFNRAYRVASKLVPAFWGQQMDKRGIELLEACGFTTEKERTITQTLYPSRIVLTRRHS